MKTGGETAVRSNKENMKGAACFFVRPFFVPTHDFARWPRVEARSRLVVAPGCGVRRRFQATP